MVLGVVVAYYFTRNNIQFNVSLSTYGGSSVPITLNNLVDLVINTAHDNRDGTMSFTGSNIYYTMKPGIGVIYWKHRIYIQYAIQFSDIAGNYVSEQIILKPKYNNIKNGII